MVTTRRFSNAGSLADTRSPMNVSAARRRHDPDSGGSRSSAANGAGGRGMSRSASVPLNRWQNPNLRSAGSFTLTSSTGKPLTSLTSKVVTTPKAAGPVSVRGRRLSMAAPGRRMSTARASTHLGPSPLRPSPLHVHGSSGSLSSSGDGSHASPVVVRAAALRVAHPLGVAAP